MKKILLLIVACFSLTGMLQAQTSGGPDTYGYVWRDSNDPNGPTYSWITIDSLPGTTEITGLSDDNFVGPILLPAPFPYYWYTVNKFWVGSNGYLGFDPFLIAAPFPTIPTTGSTQNNFLAAFMSDLNFAGAANPARCLLWKSATNDTVIVTYKEVGFWVNAVPDYDGNNTFQIILNYNDSTITYQYESQTSSSPAAVDYISVGMENNSGAIGLEWGHDQYPSTQYAIRFYPPATTTLVVNDASTVFNDNPSSAGKFLSKNGATFALNTLVKNTGNSTLPSFNVESKVQAANNTISVTNSAPTTSLLPGDTQFINQTNQFNPTTAGIFRFITTTQLAGDATPSNNARTMELGVVDTTLTTTELAYDNGISSTTTGISWSGGNGGCANLFFPPYYPCDITQVKAYILADANGFGYDMKVYDNSGPNGTRGNLLDSVNVAPATFTVGSYVTTALNSPIRIDSGGFYVEWFMGGDGVALGQNQVAPFSNRAYEVLGTTMSEYRSREIEDLMIRAVIAKVGVGVNENKSANGFGEFFPNPSSEFSTITFDASAIKGSRVFAQVFDVNGRVVYSGQFNTADQRVVIPVKELSSGIYSVRLSSENTEVTKKLNVIK